MTPALFVQTALRFVGLPYKWGGVFPQQGLDCSALARILLHASGQEFHIPGNAQSLFEFFSQDGYYASVEPQVGALVFYGADTQSITHIAICLDSSTHIEAAGGDHTTVDLNAAIAQDAWIRVTPIRTNHLGIFLPKYSWL